METKDRIFAIAKKGDVVFLEYDGYLKQEIREHITKSFDRLKGAGVLVVILEGGMRVARIDNGTP